MTPDGARPGLRLLESLLPEERLGRPAAALAEALTAAGADPANAHVHLLDAACAALVAGEPRTANRLLDRAQASAPGDDTWRRRLAAARVWSWALDRNWYPGDVAAETVSLEIPEFPPEQPGDPETCLLEAIANEAHALRSLRTQVETQSRQNPQNALGLAQAGGVNAQRLLAALEAAGAASSALVPYLAFTDLLQRAGRQDDAASQIAHIRTQPLSPHGLACTFLLEGDWYATPGSSPEALGFDLGTESVPSPFLERRDLARAAAAYDRADDALAEVDEPRTHAALALRRAACAWLAGSYEEHAKFAAQAGEAFAAAGDAAGQRLAAAHGLLAQVALGRIAATRRAAGTGFDLEPRGPVAELVSWAGKDGSISWATGIGRLYQRAAERWDRDRDYERAAVAYELAAPLVPLTGAETPAAVLLELAGLDRRNGFGVRALTRCRSAIDALPPISDARTQMLDWSRNVNAALDVVMIQLDATATAAGMNFAALEWACGRVRELLALPGVPPAGGVALDLGAAQREWAERTLDDLRAEAGEEVPAPMLAMLTGVAEAARGLVAVGDAYGSFQRGRQAAGIGATATADRWFADALAKVGKLPGDAGPLNVMILAARDRFDEAQARLRELLEAPGQDPALLAAAAVRARDYATALRLLGTEPDTGRPWADLLDHAEAALETGDVELASTLTEAAVGDFEERFAQLRRDVDRVAVSDDVKVAALYLLAARSQLAREADPQRTARAFELSDRARALALTALLADASDETDDERLILGWRRTTAEWQAAYERLFRAYVAAAADDEVAARVSELATAEDALVEVEADIETRGPTSLRRPPRREPPALGDVQASLPADAALLEYQLVGRDLLVWAITRTTADAETTRHPTGEIARLAKTVQRACANGDPGPEAAELAAILLEPVASVAAACRRLVVVPYGQLHGLPFQVLPLGGHALGESHVLSYLPAAALLAGRAFDEPLTARHALVVGDPAFEGAAHPALHRLPGAAVEAGAVAGTHGVEPLIGAAAGEAAIRQRLPACDVVHLAAHGRLDPVAPSDSSIVLAGRDELTVSDLVGLRIDSELAILSACDSGRGAASLGGDVVGLARGLIAAGARRSVVSLWPVDDAPACVTMSLFHEHLSEGLPPAEALHSAQSAVHALSGAELSARYVALSGAADATASTRRRGAASTGAAPALVLDPEFVDDLADAEPGDDLSGGLARVWAPFVVIGA